MLGPARSSACLYKTFTKHHVASQCGRPQYRAVAHGGEIALADCVPSYGTRQKHSLPTSLLHSDDYHDRRPAAASVKAAKTARKLGTTRWFKPVSRLREASVPQGLLSNFR
jgi:hypothetical protein